MQGRKALQKTKGKKALAGQGRQRWNWAEVDEFEAYFRDKWVVLHEGVNVRAEGTGNQE